MTKTLKESLLILGIGAISSGVSLIPSDIIAGLALAVVGIAVLFIRGYLKK